MFATVLDDVFTTSDREAVHVALDDLCSPLDAYGWASVGIYCFFRPLKTSDGVDFSNVLYIGLARDLPERFAQHVGRVRFAPEGCKQVQIDKWFAEHEQLGFACFVQSALAQVDTHRERDRFKRAAYDEELSGGFASNPPEGLEAAKVVEGQSFETYRLEYGTLPPWNKTGGSVEGQNAAIGGSAGGLLRQMGGARDSVIRARRTIRQLAQDPAATTFETGALHHARMTAILGEKVDGASNDSVLARLRSYYELGFGMNCEYDAMMQSNYLAPFA